MPAGWTPDQIRQFQDYWDTEFAGDLAKRRRAKFVPGESAVRVHQTKEPEHKQDFDEWLARIICYAFSVPPQWAVKLMNRATAENQSAQAEEEGLEPTKEWVKDLVDEVIADEFASPDLELAWLDEDVGAAEIEKQFGLRRRHRRGADWRPLVGISPMRYVSLITNWGASMAAFRALAIATCSLVILGTAARADDAPSQTGAFLAYCKTNGEGCIDRVAGMSFAMQVTNATKKEWCPGKETDDVKVLTPKVIAWLTAHPEVNNKMTNDGIRTALIQLYPCKR